MTTLGLPGKVGGLNKVTFISSRSVLIKWNMVLDNGGEEILHYKIGLSFESNSIEKKFWSTQNTSITINGIEYEDFNLSVQAANCHGEGLPMYINVKLPRPDVNLVVILSICFVAVICIVTSIFVALLTVFLCHFRKKVRSI